MNTTFFTSLTIATLAAVAYGASIKTEVKVVAATLKPGEELKPCAGSQKAFEDGQLYYHAMPSCPAPGTAVKVIETKDDTDYICRTFRLKTRGISAELASYLRTTVEKENGKVDVSVNTKTGEEFLIITAPVFQFLCLEDTIEKLDRPGTKFRRDGAKIQSYKLKNRLASEVTQFMDDALISKDGSVYADNRVNKIYLIDSPSYFDATMSFVSEFDVPPEMVRIEAEIVEIEMDDDFNFGLALDAWKEGLPEEVNMDIDWSEAEWS